MPGMPHKAHHYNQCQQRAEQQFERNHTLLFGAAGVISLQPELIRLYFNVVLCDCQDGVEGGQRLAVQDGRFCGGLPCYRPDHIQLADAEAAQQRPHTGAQHAEQVPHIANRVRPDCRFDAVHKAGIFFRLWFRGRCFRCRGMGSSGSRLAGRGRFGFCRRRGWLGRCGGSRLGFGRVPLLCFCLRFCFFFLFIRFARVQGKVQRAVTQL